MVDEPAPDRPPADDAVGAFDQVPTTTYDPPAEQSAAERAAVGVAPTERETQTRPFPVSHEAVIEDAGLQAFVDRALRPEGGRMVTYGEVARGGMGVIERIDDRVLLRQTAVKVIRDEYRLDEPAIRDFVREAQITGQLEHPNIIPIYELGSTHNGRLCLVMRLVEGRTLANLIEALPAGPLERGRLLDLIDIILRVCDALAFAHSRGVVHCDVKPGNVMVAAFGQVYLMDWGIAQLIDVPGSVGVRPVTCSVDANISNPVRGTPSCMSPEQAQGMKVDVRTDVFAVGVLLFAILCRRPPYAYDDAEMALEQAAECRFSLPAEVAESAPELSRIVQRAMQLKKAGRYATIIDLQRDLVRLVRGGWDFPRIDVKAGQAVVVEGEVGDAAYIIEQGRCEVTKEIEGRLVRLREMGAGEVFGETAILAASPRTATVVALEPTVLLKVTREVLEAEVGAMKPWMSTFIRTLARRFRDREERG